MPAVAAISTGLPSSASSSSTSKNDLNSPLYDALKTGVTAITASAAATDGDGVGQRAGREAGQQVVGDRVGEVAQLDHLDVDRGPARSRARPTDAAASWSASSRVDDGWLSPAVTTTSLGHADTSLVDGDRVGRRRARRGSARPARAPA